jgi:hypothetical protein
MYCNHCGVDVMPGQVFCSKCGQPIAGAVASPSTAPPAPPLPATSQTSAPSLGTGFAGPSRVAKHLNVLGILWIVYSVLRLIPGVALMVFGHMRFPFLLTSLPVPMRGLLGPFLGALGLAISALAIAGLVAAWGLMAHCPWARMLTIVLGCISLIHFPLGTALGIYTLWVLIPGEASKEYQRLASGT